MRCSADACRASLAAALWRRMLSSALDASQTLRQTGSVARCLPAAGGEAPSIGCHGHPSAVCDDLAPFPRRMPTVSSDHNMRSCGFLHSAALSVFCLIQFFGGVFVLCMRVVPCCRSVTGAGLCPPAPPFPGVTSSSNSLGRHPNDAANPTNPTIALLKV